MLIQVKKPKQNKNGTVQALFARYLHLNHFAAQTVGLQNNWVKPYFKQLQQ